MSKPTPVEQFKDITSKGGFGYPNFDKAAEIFFKEEDYKDICKAMKDHPDFPDFLKGIIMWEGSELPTECRRYAAEFYGKLQQQENV